MDGRSLQFRLTRLVPPWMRPFARRCRDLLSRGSSQLAAAPIPAASPSAREIESLVTWAYRVALERTASAEERSSWVNHAIAHQMSAIGVVDAITTSEEAKQVQARGHLLPDVSDGQFIQFTYEYLLGRGVMAAEVAHWQLNFTRHDLRRDRMVLSFFNQRASEVLGLAPPALNDPGIAHIMGTDKVIKVNEWQERAAALAQTAQVPSPRIYPSLAFQRDGDVLVSAIASLYRGGDYIEQFLENITSQTIFESCELIIIDADSPENESEVISRYMARFPNIVYHRAATRIGIYEAWNVGVRLARGRFLTNTNLDDLRRRDSFERQAEILMKFPFVDVVYQDFYYSFDGKASVEKTALVGVRSEVPIVTPYNLMRSNSPHNAPMWRRELHEDVGMFDASYRSAGDYDFWLRCVVKNKVFYKVNDPHVVYFVNPEGLSTQPNTRGIDEGNRVTREHGRAVNSPWLLSPDDDFIRQASQALGAPIEMSESERSSQEWRYAALQKALRLTSIASRSRSAGSSACL